MLVAILPPCHQLNRKHVLLLGVFVFHFNPKSVYLLLNPENDLQLLLLAANAVVGGKQLLGITKLLKHIDKEIDEEKVNNKS